MIYYHQEAIGRYGETGPSLGVPARFAVGAARAGTRETRCRAQKMASSKGGVWHRRSWGRTGNS